MRAELERSGLQYREKPKDGAFYAPKIDIQIEDALGREWQTATIQVDRVMLPERFDLWYIDEEGHQQRPVAIHRAIYGSLERFIGVLTEHFAGAFPLWVAPVQAVVIPIADRHIEAANELAGVLRSRGLRIEVDESVEPDAEQDPPGPGAEGPVHGRPGRPRDRGADGVAADPRRRAAAGRAVGRLRRSPGRRIRAAAPASDSIVGLGTAYAILPLRPCRVVVSPRRSIRNRQYEGDRPSVETCASTR